MAFRTLGDIKNEVLVKLNSSTSLAFYTDANLGAFINDAYLRAAAYKKWPFTEGRVSTTYSTTEEWNFEGYKNDSFRFIQIGGKRLQKLNFEDYQIFRENEPSASDRVYSDFNRTLFINPSVDVSGTLTAWGQYQPLPMDLTDPNSVTVFSDFDDEGNEAIIQLTLSYAKAREKKLQDSEYHLGKAKEILDNMWERVEAEQSVYQTHPDRGGMFKRFDVLRGGLRDEVFKRDQFL